MGVSTSSYNCCMTDLCIAGHDFRQSVVRHAVGDARFRRPENESTVDLRSSDAVTYERYSDKIVTCMCRLRAFVLADVSTLSVLSNDRNLKALIVVDLSPNKSIFI